MGLNYINMNIKCLTDRFGNFTKDKLYTISGLHEYPDSTPANFIVYDDDGDAINIEILLRKPTKFILV